jgi:hypothetical protein
MYPSYTVHIHYSTYHSVHYVLYIHIVCMHVLLDIWHMAVHNILHTYHTVYSKCIRYLCTHICSTLYHCTYMGIGPTCDVYINTVHTYITIKHILCPNYSMHDEYCMYLCTLLYKYVWSIIPVSILIL